MKKIYFLFIVLFSKSIIAQENLFDKWQSVNTFSATTVNNMQEYRTAITVGDKIIAVMDTAPMGMFNYSGLFTYDINTRSINPLTFTLAPGDRGITCASVYKTSTPGLSYGLFGCLSSPDVGASYPVIYTYNSQTNSISADSLTIGSWQDNDGGMKHIAMYSPLTDNDTIRVFSTFNLSTHVFKKQINQTGFVATSNLIPIDNISCSFTYNNKLYIGGTYNSEAALLESSDGNTFSPVAGFVPSNFSPYSFVNKMDTLNGELYYTVSIDQTGFEIFKYNTTIHSSIYQHFGPERIKDFKTFKNKLWYSYSKNESVNVSSSIFYLTSGNSIQSAEQLGYQEVDGDKLSFAATNDSLYFLGNFGTFYAAKNSNIESNLVSKNISNVYLKVWKLMPPISSFNYNNNLICLNANETFTSTSQNTDSLHWFYDGSFYASSPGPSATMNFNFSTIGSHTVGLMAFGGNLKDSTYLSVDVYAISAPILGPSNLCQGDSLHLTSNVSNGMGSIVYSWYSNGVAFGTNNPSITIISSIGTNSYNLIALDDHGCSVSSNTIITTCNPLTNMVGTVTSASVGIAGDLTLYRYEPFLTKFDSITTIPIGGFGSYTFSNLVAGDYILKAVPSSNSLQTTYYGTNAISWKDATPITHGCINPSTININVDSLKNIGTGPGKLTGTVYEGNSFGHRFSGQGKPLIPGGPIGGIIVKGGKNPGGQMFVQTVTAADGTYTLSGIPVNTGYDYFILVDIPGLDTNGTYHRILTSGTPQINGLDFNVDSIQVNPFGIATAISSENSVFENKLMLFPNPAKEVAYIEYELTESANVQIELYDLIGQKALTVLNESRQEKNRHKHSINFDNLCSGIYFVKVKINNSENVIKLVITN